MFGLMTKAAHEAAMAAKDAEIATLSGELFAAQRKIDAEKHRAVTSGRLASEALKERDEALAKIARMTGGLKRGSHKPGDGGSAGISASN